MISDWREGGPILSEALGMARFRIVWPLAACASIGVATALVLATNPAAAAPLVGAEFTDSASTLQDTSASAVLRSAQESLTSAMQQGVLIGPSRFKVVVSSSKLSLGWSLSF